MFRIHRCTLGWVGYHKQQIVRFDCKCYIARRLYNSKRMRLGDPFRLHGLTTRSGINTSTARTTNDIDGLPDDSLANMRNPFNIITHWDEMRVRDSLNIDGAFGVNRRATFVIIGYRLNCVQWVLWEFVFCTLYVVKRGLKQYCTPIWLKRGLKQYCTLIWLTLDDKCLFLFSDTFGTSLPCTDQTHFWCRKVVRITLFTNYYKVRSCCRWRCCGEDLNRFCWHRRTIFKNNFLHFFSDRRRVDGERNFQILRA